MAPRAPYLFIYSPHQQSPREWTLESKRRTRTEASKGYGHVETPTPAAARHSTSKRPNTGPTGWIPRCTASASAQFRSGEAGFLVLQPPPPSPPSPRVRTQLTCLPKGSEETVPPPESCTPRAHVGAGRLSRKQAPPPPHQQGGHAPWGTLPAGWSPPAAASHTHVRREAWPIECAEGLVSLPLPTLVPAHGWGKPEGAHLRGTREAQGILRVNLSCSPLPSLAHTWWLVNYLLKE